MNKEGRSPDLTLLQNRSACQKVHPLLLTGTLPIHRFRPVGLGQVGRTGLATLRDEKESNIVTQ